jgi:hypothetical protein
MPESDRQITDAVAGGGAGDDDVGRAPLISLAKERVLYLKVLKNRFDDKIGSGNRLGESGGYSDTLKDSLNTVTADSDGAVTRTGLKGCLDALDRSIQDLPVPVGQGDLQSGLGEHQGYAMSHGARPDYGESVDSHSIPCHCS